MKYVAILIFRGCEVRPWIDWLEKKFVESHVSNQRKLNLAKSLMEGEARVWFDEIHNVFPFKSWEKLRSRVMIQYGDKDDPERVRLIFEQDREMRKWREATAVRRSNTTSLKAREPISVEKSIQDDNIMHVGHGIDLKPARTPSS
ncbi:unnamed protein product [Cochlearia groenlandica]